MKSSEKRAILMATPTHGNLGDQAIVYAEYKMLEDLGIKRIIEVKNDYYLNYNSIIKKFIAKTDLIVIDGGGNIGSLWPWENDKISQIISDYNDNKITIFPQTAYYDTDNYNLLQRDIEVYKSHKDLTVFLRDKKSYDFFVENFIGVRSYYTPDIVLYLKPSIMQKPRNGVLLCFRGDLEQVIDEKLKNKVIEKIKEHQLDMRYISTLVDNAVTVKNRDRELLKKWECFASAKLVITDRLHSMIFATITGTPCIAFDNRSKKVSGVYKWISHLPYIECINAEDNFDIIFEKMVNMDTMEYSGLINDFSKMKEVIK